MTEGHAELKIATRFVGGRRQFIRILSSSSTFPFMSTSQFMRHSMPMAVLGEGSLSLKLSPRHDMHGALARPDAALNRLNLPLDVFVEVISLFYQAIYARPNTSKISRFLRPRDLIALARTSKWIRKTVLYKATFANIWRNSFENVLPLPLPACPKLLDPLKYASVAFGDYCFVRRTIHCIRSR